MGCKLLIWGMRPGSLGRGDRARRKTKKGCINGGHGLEELQLSLSGDPLGGQIDPTARKEEASLHPAPHPPVTGWGVHPAGPVCPGTDSQVSQPQSHWGPGLWAGLLKYPLGFP